MPKLDGTGPVNGEPGKGRKLGVCKQSSTDDLLKKLGKGKGKRRKSGGGEGHGKRLKSGIESLGKLNKSEE
ncbi:MAG: DUF5320 family protein [Salinivirgaceae bacterium]|nr:DUF5320 family protein [Salinivirgaceae bacterium]MDD4745825.1 DUF5320 family protein [Salinivirgaceae bacterium]MDY0280227.1 DUF5320 family protein [Salinivirgaceae bacterium]